MCKEDILHNFFLAMRKYCVRLHQMVIASNDNCKFLHYTDYFHIQIICYIMSILRFNEVSNKHFRMRLHHKEQM